MKILVMGLPGSGKSTFAEPFAKSLFATWINADQVRERYDDWDFSNEGRIRQSQRMKHLSDGVVMAGGVAVADFICPTEETRREFDADFTIWMATIGVGKYEDTNRIFIEPEDYDIRIFKMDRCKPTVQMLGRFQPWHKGHRELFKRAHAKTGQVVIMVRDTGETWHDRDRMIDDLKSFGYKLAEDFIVMDVPNIVNITYGRGVGYKIEQEHLGEEIEKISATEIRNEKSNMV